MVFTVNSYSVPDSKTDPKPDKLERRDVKPDDVLISIDYTGVCHSDVHQARNDWGGSNYPMVPGHEIVGTVEKVGDKVTKHKVGDVVAVGCMVDSCLKCEQCKLDHEVFCPEMVQTYGQSDKNSPGQFTAGGYSEKIVVGEHFVCSVPKELQTPDLLPGVAPILCAGITSYSPMVTHNLKAGQKCAIVGLGGLGSMGVKLAKAIGAEVTVISRSHSKDELAKSYGASAVIASSSEEEMKANAGKFDLIIDTVPLKHDVNPYLPLVKPYGTFTVVGLLGETEKPINTLGLIFGNRSFSGSAIGGMKLTQDLLNFCGKNKIVANHEMIEMKDVSRAWKALADGVSEKRFIIDVKKFREGN